MMCACNNVCNTYSTFDFLSLLFFCCDRGYGLATSAQIEIKKKKTRTQSQSLVNVQINQSNFDRSELMMNLLICRL